MGFSPKRALSCAFPAGRQSFASLPTLSVYIPLTSTHMQTFSMKLSCILVTRCWTCSSALISFFKYGAHVCMQGYDCVSCLVAGGSSDLCFLHLLDDLSASIHCFVYTITPTTFSCTFSRIFPSVVYSFTLFIRPA